MLVKSSSDGTVVGDCDIDPDVKEDSMTAVKSGSLSFTYNLDEIAYQQSAWT